MFITKGKTNWSYILIVIILAAIVSAGALFLNQGWPLGELAALVVKEPVPSPTEINQNFLTQVNECFIPVAALYGYTLRITSGFRSISEQEQTFNQGRTV